MNAVTPYLQRLVEYARRSEHVVFVGRACPKSGRSRPNSNIVARLGLESLVLHRVVQSANGQLRATGFTGKKAK